MPDNTAPKSFAQNLRHLIHRAHLHEGAFVREFSRNMVVDRRTPLGWLSASAVKSNSHIPLQENLDKVAKYFAGKLGCPRISAELFYLEPDVFAERVADLLQGVDAPKEDAPYHLPFAPDKLQRAFIAHYAGTYHLYRYSLVGSEAMIVRDVGVISGPAAENVMSVDLFADAARKPQRGTLQDVVDTEHYKGSLVRFGRTMLIAAAYINEETFERRLRFMHFPVLQIRTDVHYGLLTSYSPHLEEPVAARVLARKVSSETSPTSEHREQVKILRPAEPEVRDIERLLNNHISPEINVLAVDKRLAQEIV